MKRQFVLLVLLFSFLFSIQAHAHPGATDEYGGHYDYDAGEYHYHHGYPAHFHGFGSCPYDFDDRTGEDSGSPGIGSSTHLYTTAPRPVQTAKVTTPKHDSDLLTGMKWLGMMIAVFVFLFIMSCVFSRRPRKPRTDSTKIPPPSPPKQSDTLSTAYIEAHNLNRLSGLSVTTNTRPRMPAPPPPTPLPPPEPAPVPPPSPTPEPETVAAPPSRKIDTPVPVPDPVPPITITPSVVPGDPEPEEGDIPDCPNLYRSQYPATWSYINRNAEHAESYIYYYHFVWGELQAKHGDGIIYGSLSEDEQALVNYPPVGKTVFISAVNSKTYHSTPDCYALLKSTPIEVDAIHTIVRKRCTKCVAPRDIE